MAQRFRCAEAIAHYGKLSGEGRGGLVAESGVGTLGVVGVNPVGDGVAGVIDAEEQGLVEKFVAHPATNTHKGSAQFLRLER